MPGVAAPRLTPSPFSSAPCRYGIKGQLFALTKGAPEALRVMIKDPPSHYMATYHHHASRGSRVLALAMRAFEPSVGIDDVRAQTRDDVEAGLTFVGFVVRGVYAAAAAAAAVVLPLPLSCPTAAAPTTARPPTCYNNTTTPTTGIPN